MADGAAVSAVSAVSVPALRLLALVRENKICHIVLLCLLLALNRYELITPASDLH